MLENFADPFKINAFAPNEGKIRCKSAMVQETLKQWGIQIRKVRDPRQSFQLFFNKSGFFSFGVIFT
jgi:hypothetical protein